LIYIRICLVEIRSRSISLKQLRNVLASNLV
jgi:hypothetical protein